ncbi:MAG: cell division protein FtsK [Desulfuromonas sp.]|mgnify:CR=1 FL=1|nr:MAG: cell division protein FtsK [Desulfuromonas sp.]
MSNISTTTAREKLQREIFVILLSGIGLFLLLALFSYSSTDPSFNNNYDPQKIANLGGRIGAYLADALLQGFGLAALLFPLFFFASALRRLRQRRPPRFTPLLATLLLLSLDGIFGLWLQNVQWSGHPLNGAGGLSGRLLADLMLPWLNRSGATLVLAIFLLILLPLLTGVSIPALATAVGQRLVTSLASLRQRQKKEKAVTTEKPQKSAPTPTTPILDKQSSKDPPPSPPKPSPPPAKKKEKAKKTTPPKLDIQDPPDTTGSRPSLSLLNHDGEAAPDVDKAALQRNAETLSNKFRDFKIDGEVVAVKPGPVVTMYEFAPAPGVKVNKIAGLSDDLSMALRAHSIRIVAPIPGRGAVGIEIPNPERETVWLKEIFASDEFQKTGGALPMALGKDIFGKTVVSDLAKMPHLLVAGSTGSGKSVSINTMILSLLYRASPQDVRIIMVDPKMLELSIYEGIPHLLLPVVTNPKKATLALNWAVREMERRYKLMADKGVRNIDGYNKRLADEEAEKSRRRANDEVVLEAAPDIDEEFPPFAPEEGEELEHGHLPYIVVIVDELADLMMVAGRDIEEAIARLAQMARAAGIHLILATQRPSVDVITGLIKANFPTRISFKVFSRTDSRTILDQMGAENLLGMGDMLFLPPGTGALQRVHGAFVSEKEVQRVVDFLKLQGEPEYDPSILTPPAGGEGGGDNDDEGYDEKWDEALAVVAETRQASGSMLQRRLGVGYNRAMRMIERMEQEGIVGPAQGNSKPREVFIGRIPPAG